VARNSRTTVQVLSRGGIIFCLGFMRAAKVPSSISAFRSLIAGALIRCQLLQLRDVGMNGIGEAGKWNGSTSASARRMIMVPAVSASRRP